MNSQFFASNYGYPTLKTPSYKVENDQRFYSAEEGYVKGNLDRRIYKGYRNYQPLMPTKSNERCSRLIDIGIVYAAKHDLKLILDVYPQDQELIRMFNKYRLEEKRLVEDYERKYGPLDTCSSAMENYPWAWVEGPWPWEGDK